MDTLHSHGDDAVFCASMLPRVSRTFALSISLLPSPLKEGVGVAYLLCRVVDTIEDDPNIDPAIRERLFRQFEAQIEDDSLDSEVFSRNAGAIGETADEAALITGSGAVFREWRRLESAQRSAIKPWVRKMSQGMSEYAARFSTGRGVSIRDMDDLEEYCGFVAGTVGGLLTGLFRLSVPSVGTPEDSQYKDGWVFGLGLQMVNVLRDVAEDSKRGVCWLPASLLDEFNLDRDHMFDATELPKLHEVVSRVAAAARRHLEVAGRYTLSWPSSAQPVRLFCAVPLALAWLSLDHIESSFAASQLEGTPKISRATVQGVAEKAIAASGNDNELARWLDDLAASRWQLT